VNCHASPAFGNELDNSDAHKQLFLRRLKAHFRASHFSMILRLHKMGILGKRGFWATFAPDSSLRLAWQPASFALLADSPKEERRWSCSGGEATQLEIA
jgi:hypothetical protein